MTAALGAAEEAQVVVEERGPLAPVAATLGLVRPALGRLALASLLGAFAIGATIALMATSAWMLSRASEHPGEASLGLAIVAVQFFGLSRGFARYGERLVGHDAAFRLLADVRVRFYDRVETLAPCGLPAFSRGELVTRMVADVDGLQELLLRVVPPSLAALLAGALTVGGLWVALPAAGAITLVALVAAACAVPWATSAISRRAATHEADLRGALAARFVDLVDGAAELAVLGAADGVLDEVRRLDDELRATTARTAWLQGLGLSLTTLLAGLAAAGNLAVGVAAVRRGALPGVLLATLAVVPLAAFELVSPLPLAAQSLTRARRAAARVFDVLSTPAPVTEPSDPVPVGAAPHHVAARGVVAGYAASPTPVLRDVELSLAPGRLVAVVGASGAGKSTLGAVLVDFLTPSAGQVSLDGVGYTARSGDDVRGVVGLLDQQPHLFDASIAANLRVARPDASDEELAGVLDAVGLGEELRALPDGLATGVGRVGSRLSGGQRQRVAAARALLARWPVLVLDEPTEHLEPAAADALLTTLLAADATRATVLITHRLEWLDRVDEVLVLERGSVVERGTHAELVALGGRYAAWLGDPGVANAVGQAS